MKLLFFKETRGTYQDFFVRNRKLDDSSLFKEKNLLRFGKKNFKIQQAQVAIEFIFSMIILFIMVYSLLRIYCWTGEDLVQRQLAHETTILGKTSYDDFPDPYFYTSTPMNAIWRGY